MSKPIAIDQGIAFAFPDICNTPAPPPVGSVPIPYPNVAQLAEVEAKVEAKTDQNGELVIGPNKAYALLEGASIKTSTGNEAGSLGGVKSGQIKGPCKLTQASSSVLYGPGLGKGLVRFMDATDQNGDNAKGLVLSAFPTILVGD